VNLPRFHVVILSLALTGLAGCGYFISSHHNIEEYTPVFAAADSCDLATVRKDVDQDPAVLKATEWDDATLLHDAVGHNCTDLTAYLLNAGADANAVKTDGVTPLHLAAQRGNVQIAELLLEHGAKINAVDDKGWTPLDRAEKWQHPDAAAFLKEHGGYNGKSGN